MVIGAYNEAEQTTFDSDLSTGHNSHLKQTSKKAISYL
jgi:hypothetical protein